MEFNGNNSVFTFMAYVANRTIYQEMSAPRLEASIREIVRKAPNGNLLDLLTQSILIRIEENILQHPEVEQALLEKGYDPRVKISQFETEVVNALCQKFSEISVTHTNVQNELPTSVTFLPMKCFLGFLLVVGVVNILF